MSSGTETAALSIVDTKPTMYSTSWCGYCLRLKRQMQRESIEFDEVNIETDDRAAQVVERVNDGNQTVPTMVFASGVALTNPTIDEVRAALQ